MSWYDDNSGYGGGGYENTGNGYGKSGYNNDYSGYGNSSYDKESGYKDNHNYHRHFQGYRNFNNPDKGGKNGKLFFLVVFIVAFFAAGYFLLF